MHKPYSLNTRLQPAQKVKRERILKHSYVQSNLEFYILILYNLDI